MCNLLVLDALVGEVGLRSKPELAVIPEERQWFIWLCIETHLDTMRLVSGCRTVETQCACSRGES